MKNLVQAKIGLGGPKLAAKIVPSLHVKKGPKTSDHKFSHTIYA